MDKSAHEVKLISFDLDNALYDNTPVLNRADRLLDNYLENEFKKQNVSYDFKNYLSIKQALLEKNDPLYENMSLLRQTALEDFCINLKDKNNITREAFNVFIQARSEITIHQAVQDMLVKLSNHYLLVTVTNGNCEIHKHEISQVFEKHYSPTMGYRAKPHPQMLNQAMDEFKLQPNQLLHVGDSIEMDGGAASNVGAAFYHLAPFEEGAYVEASCERLLQFLV